VVLFAPDETTRASSTCTPKRPVETDTRSHHGHCQTERLRARLAAQSPSLVVTQLPRRSQSRTLRELERSWDWSGRLPTQSFDSAPPPLGRRIAAPHCASLRAAKRRRYGRSRPWRRQRLAIDLLVFAVCRSQEKSAPWHCASTCANSFDRQTNRAPCRRPSAPPAHRSLVRRPAACGIGASTRSPTGSRRLVSDYGCGRRCAGRRHGARLVADLKEFAQVDAQIHGAGCSWDGRRPNTSRSIARRWRPKVENGVDGRPFGSGRDRNAERQFCGPSGARAVEDCVGADRSQSKLRSSSPMCGSGCAPRSCVTTKLGIGRQRARKRPVDMP